MKSNHKSRLRQIDFIRTKAPAATKEKEFVISDIRKKIQDVILKQNRRNKYMTHKEELTRNMELLERNIESPIYQCKSDMAILSRNATRDNYDAFIN